MPTRTSTFATGDILTAADLNALAGPWNSWVPVVDQGATTNIAATIGRAKYLQFGLGVEVEFQVTLTAAGTAGSAVVVSLPVNALSGTTGMIVGIGSVYDVSATGGYTCRVELYGTAVRFVRADTITTASGWWGADPNVALASGDILRARLVYEAA